MLMTVFSLAIVPPYFKTSSSPSGDGPENFVFTDEGKLDKCLGVDIQKTNDRNGFLLTQPFLIEQILQAVEIDIRMTNSQPTSVVGQLLSNGSDDPPCKHTWKYWTLTGMLGYLQQTSRPEISMATHQCAYFNNDPSSVTNVQLYAFANTYWTKDYSSSVI